MSTPQAPRKPLLPPHAVKLLAIAFGIGLLLFLMLWLDQRNDKDFFKGAGPGTSNGEVESLPAPLPPDVAIDDGNASGLRLPRQDDPRPVADDLPRIIDEPMPAPPVMPEPPPPPPSVVSGSEIPVPISQPAPRYPREALRRNVGGTVRVEVTVAPDGSVERMQVAESSGDRFLDRAAMESVRRWRFRPAVRNGQPITATVVVPIVFNPGR